MSMSRSTLTDGLWTILLIGRGDVGKTSYAHRFTPGIFGTSPGSFVLSKSKFPELHFVFAENLTLDENHQREILIDGVPDQVNVWDAWSQRCYIGVDTVIRKAHAYILMYSVTDRYTFEDVVGYFSRVRRVTTNPDTICVLVGNKSDLTDKRVVTTEEGAALARELDCEFCETSAKTGENVELVVHSVVQALRHAASMQEAERIASGRTISQKMWDLLRCKYIGD